MIQKRIAVVTGSSSGIGVGIAGRLAAAGMNAVLSEIEPEDQIDPIRRENEAVVTGMKAKDWGRIINIASPFRSAYVAAKHGIFGLTKTIAHEVAEHSNTVNAICPGYVWTPLVEKQIRETAKTREMKEAQVVRGVLLPVPPTKSFATVEEVAALAVFLTRDKAASITGTALPVDSGWTAH